MTSHESYLVPAPQDILMSSMTQSMFVDLVTLTVNECLDLRLADYKKSDTEDSLEEVMDDAKKSSGLDKLADSNTQEPVVTEGWAPPIDGAQPLNVVRLDDLELYLGNVTPASP